MLFAPDMEWSLRAAVELVNTAQPPDTLTSRAEVEQWFTEHRYTGRLDRDEAELEALRATRSELRGLLTADRVTAAGLANSMLAQARALPQLVRHDDLDWHIHAIASDAPLDRRIIVETAMAMTDLIRADELSRLSVCADRSCGGLVLDLSRNRSRRYCSTRCSNRAAAAAYRARGRSAIRPEHRATASGPRSPECPSGEAPRIP
jgi:predicted RNA-binding Zn ribbon-like protein